MTKLLAAIKELDFPMERLRWWYFLCSQRKPFVFSCVVFIHASWLVLFDELIPVNSVATNTNHQYNPNHTDHIKVLTLLRQLLQTHTEFKKNTTYMNTNSCNCPTQ